MFAARQWLDTGRNGRQKSSLGRRKEPLWLSMTSWWIRHFYQWIFFVIFCFVIKNWLIRHFYQWISLVKFCFVLHSSTPATLFVLRVPWNTFFIRFSSWSCIGSEIVAMLMQWVVHACTCLCRCVCEGSEVLLIVTADGWSSSVQQNTEFVLLDSVEIK